jgi:superfamily II DNA or RNA helicase
VVQNPQVSARSGDLLRVRSRVWRLQHVAVDGVCAAWTLRGVDPANRLCTRVLIAPVERAERLTRSLEPRRVHLSRWKHGLTAFVAATAAPDLPISAAFASVDLLPHQLAPAIAFLSGFGSRLLLADEAGLGKTVQAALLLGELRARHLLSRALVVVPAGLREQWRRELWDRVRIDAEVCDAEWVERSLRALAPDLNPWSTPGIRIVSTDYLKQPEVVHAAAAVLWDVVIVDEAHTLTPSTNRARAGDLVGRSARAVVLLTATPHQGDTELFRGLCRTGLLAQDERLLVFRRTRADVGLPSDRRNLVLRVKPSPLERRAHDRLAHYIRRVWNDPGRTLGARLAMLVLIRRALSSMHALAVSLERRLQLLESESASDQLALPFEWRASGVADGDEVEDEVLRAPGMSDRTLERAWLSALRSLASRAARDGRKAQAIVRLVRRIREPAIVFTEYRDTLNALAAGLNRLAPIAVLHGGQTPETRAAALADFQAGRARLLLATDAASEGLNLHHRCRLVVVNELPWNPNRLEQRIGRVDRLGQSRRVHAISLVAADTQETRFLERLTVRRERITTALGRDADRHDGLSWVDLSDRSRTAASELESLRRLAHAPAGRAPTLADLNGVEAEITRRSPWTSRAVTSRRCVAEAGHAVSRTKAIALLYASRLRDRTGQVVASVPTTLLIDLLDGREACDPIRVVKQLLAVGRTELESVVSRAAHEDVARWMRWYERWAARVEAREAALAREVRRRRGQAQLDLFGRQHSATERGVTAGWAIGGPLSVEPDLWLALHIT